jgi:hypothetical protein
LHWEVVGGERRVMGKAPELSISGLLGWASVPPSALTKGPCSEEQDHMLVLLSIFYATAVCLPLPTPISMGNGGGSTQNVSISDRVMQVRVGGADRRQDSGPRVDPVGGAGLAPPRAPPPRPARAPGRRRQHL